MTPATKIRLQLALILIIAILGALFTWPKGPNWIRDEVKLHLGLDLAGGAHLVYQADVSDIPSDSRDSAVEGTR
jgi:preprotein translocase subunit SecD